MCWPNRELRVHGATGLVYRMSTVARVWSDSSSLSTSSSQPVTLPLGYLVSSMRADGRVVENLRVPRIRYTIPIMRGRYPSIDERQIRVWTLATSSRRQLKKPRSLKTSTSEEHRARWAARKEATKTRVHIYVLRTFERYAARKLAPTRARAGSHRLAFRDPRSSVIVIPQLRTMPLPGGSSRER